MDNGNILNVNSRPYSQLPWTLSTSIMAWWNNKRMSRASTKLVMNIKDFKTTICIRKELPNLF